jgi:hypothetical protein
MDQVKKFNDLVINNTYVVHGYSDPINSKFGANYILIISEQNSNENFEIWSTNSLAEYISNIKPMTKFTFVVIEKNDTKYPLIENYKKERKFNMLS